MTKTNCYCSGERERTVPVLGARPAATWNLVKVSKSAAKREAKEEADLDVDDLEVAGVTNDIFEEEGKHYITIAMRAKSYAGVPKVMEPQKCDALRWFPLNHLPTPLFTPCQNYFDSDPLCLCGSGVRFKKCHGT